ncbi:alpha/beta fold hydrolase [Shewanella waksmanii]|uniref:alpha/beta fold hydrolase n=1 Tax=Shewanella waksmanii TaxID=213783 RepID=UPI0037359812
MWQSCPANNEVVITLPHIELTGRVWGADDKPLLLALHGWLDNANSFEPLVEHLTGDYQVLAIDWPGHGGSQHRSGGYALHWIDYLFDLDGLITHITAERPLFAIIGHSLGGLIASTYAANFPDRVAKLVLIEALVPLSEPADKARGRLIKSIEQHRQPTTKLAKPVCIDAAVKARVTLTGLAAPWSQLILSRNLRFDGESAYWRSDPRLKLDSATRLSSQQVEGLINRHTCPTLLIVGDKGYRPMTRLQQDIQHWFESLTLVELPGDHHLHMGNAVDVAQHVLDYLMPE